MHKKTRYGTRLAATIFSAVMAMGSFAGAIPSATIQVEAAVPEIPSSYSSVTEGYTPAVRSQGVFGNCWAHSALACVEISMIKNKVAPAAEVDLSEAHAVYYVYRPVADPLGGTDVDYTAVSQETVYTMFHTGNDISDTEAPFLGWMGPVDEEDFYDYGYLVSNHNDVSSFHGLNNAEHAYGNRAATVVDSVVVSNRQEEMKRAIMDYGSMAISYNSNPNNFDYTYSSQYCGTYESVTHAVTVVGWDDNFPKENFKTTPEEDGAWFVRNSWGEQHGIDGYFWLSYYDKTIAGGGHAYRAVAADKYDNNYRYDKGGTDNGYVNGVEKGNIEAANIFRIQNEKEILKAVQFGMQWSNLNYSIQIYKNPTDTKNLASGEALLDAPIQGTKNLLGKYTVDLGKNIVLEKDDVIAVVVTYSSNNPDVCPAAQTGNVGVCRTGESMYRVNGGEWKDCAESGGKNFVIRAFTKNVTEDFETHTHTWSEDWSTNALAHWHECKGSAECTHESGSGYAVHTGGTATCKNGAFCDVCGQEYGVKDGNNHEGSIVRKNAAPATTTLKGYTGDLCCSGCNVIFERGVEIPVLTEEEDDSDVTKVSNLDYVFKTLDEEEVSSHAEGKPKMIIFYGAACGHCKNTLTSFTEKKVEGVDVVAVDIKFSSKESILGLKSTLGVGKDDIHYCYDEGYEAVQAKIAYEEAFNGMTYSSLPVICYIDEDDYIRHMTSGAQTLNQIKSNLAVHCGLKTTNLNKDNPSNATFTTLDGEQVSLTAEGKPKVLVFFDKLEYSWETLQSISSENISGVEILAFDVWGQSADSTKEFVDAHFQSGSDIKVVPDSMSLFEMFEYTDAIGETNSITYPVIAYIDADNKLQHVTMGQSSLAEIRINLEANCGYKEEANTPEIPDVPDQIVTLEFQKPDKTTYLKGESLNLEGATVSVNGGEAVAVDSTMVSGFDSGEEGIVTVIVNYQNMETSFEVLIVEPQQLEVTEGICLADVSLPENAYGIYTWKNPSAELTEVGSYFYEAAFVPNNSDNYSMLENVKIKVVVKAVEVLPQPITSVTDAFVDVKAGMWYVEPIQYVYDKEIIVGDGNVFAPDDASTRAMIVVILYRLENSPKVTDYTKYDQFADLRGTRKWYSEAVAWALNEGITTGDPVANKYNPDLPVTREQLALFLWRYAQYKDEDVTVYKTDEELFGDIYVNEWAKDGFAWAADRGLIKGSESVGADGQIQYDLLPQGGATRAQLARVLQRFLEERK